jgi:hypothetical protein
MIFTKIFEEFKGEHINYLNWKFFNNEEEVKECKDFYSFSDDYQIIATDICGNFVTIKDNKIVIVDHEQPETENDYILTDELDNLVKLIKRLITVEDYIEADGIKMLKKINKDLKECKKIAPKNLKDDFEDFIDDVKLEIELLE